MTSTLKDTYTQYSKGRRITSIWIFSASFKIPETRKARNGVYLKLSVLDDAVSSCLGFRFFFRFLRFTRFRRLLLDLGLLLGVLLGIFSVNLKRKNRLKWSRASRKSLGPIKDITNLGCFALDDSDELSKDLVTPKMSGTVTDSLTYSGSTPCRIQTRCVMIRKEKNNQAKTTYFSSWISAAMMAVPSR